MPKKKTDEEFKNELKSKALKLRSLDPYISSKTKIRFECLTCGNIWEASPAQVLCGTGCPECSNRKRADKRRYTTRTYSEKLQTINPNIEVVGDYVNSVTKVKVHCKVCDNIWYVAPTSLLQGTGCPKCNKRYRRSNQEFVEELRKVKPNITPIEKYKNANTKIKVKCNRCGRIWSIAPRDLLLKSNDCPNCAHSQTSTIEQIILNSFIKLVGSDKVHNRDKTIIGKELDIYIEGLQLAIEFGAWHWHSHRIALDVEKEKLCEQAGIKLITIYEGCSQDADTSELKHVIKYRKVLSTEKNFATIQKIILRICNKYDLDSNIIIDQWPAIIKQAKEDSRKRDAEDFVKELSVKNPDIEYIRGYSGAKDPVYVLCRKCGNKWRASSAYNLLNGHGCPECARKKVSISQRTDPIEFQEQVKLVNPHITLLEEYKGPNEKILCQCKKCGTKWLVKPSNIRYKGTNCPNCAKTIKRTNEKFLKELSKLSKDIIPLEDYINGNTKIRFKCQTCNYEWDTTPQTVLNGSGCPRCGNHITITHDEFVKRVYEKNKNIEVIGRYINTKTKVKCRCSICGYEWLGIPANLMRGAGCQKCAGTLRLSDDEFKKRLLSINPNIKTITPYISRTIKIQCKCKVCGHEWEASPGNLLNGHGCPKCKANNTRKQKSKKVMCIETGEIYDSISIAKKATGITTISDCLHNRTKSAGGYHWVYVYND